MRCGLYLVLGACAAACTGREFVPALSVHAVWVLQRRTRDEVASGRDLAVTAQLAFGGSRERRQKFAREPPSSMQRLALQSAPACEEAALCEWARMAEESALAALGVTP